MNQYLSLSEKLANFTKISRYPGLYGVRVSDYTYKEKRLLSALFLTVWNSRNIQSRVKDEATVGARGCYASPTFAYVYFRGEIERLISSVWVSPLLFHVDRQCEKPLMVGRQRESDPTLFLCAKTGGGVAPR